LFAESDAKGNIRRLVWIQIERQLPGQNWQYNYPSPDRTRLGELEFITDSKAFPAYAADDPASDHAQVDRQLRGQKLQFAGPVMRLRMIYLPDAERRRELMIIYAVPLSSGQAGAIPEDGVQASQWPEQLAKLKSMAERDVRVGLAHH
jgi:hypothetical protein